MFAQASSSFARSRIPAVVDDTKKPVDLRNEHVMKLAEHPQCGRALTLCFVCFLRSFGFPVVHCTKSVWLMQAWV